MHLRRKNRLHKLWNKSKPYVYIFGIGGALGLGAKKMVESKLAGEGESIRQRAQIEKAQKALNFNPATKLSDGVPKFVNWYREYHKAERSSQPACNPSADGRSIAGR